MKSDLPANLRLNRVAILGEWRDRLAASLEASCLVNLKMPFDLLPTLFDEILGLLERRSEDPTPCHHGPPVVGEVTDFPANISVCLKLLKAGQATVKAFLIDRCKVFRMESKVDRDRIMDDLNTATHMLIHREIQGICEQSLRPITQICERIEGRRDAIDFHT